MILSLYGRSSLFLSTTVRVSGAETRFRAAHYLVMHTKTKNLSYVSSVRKIFVMVSELGGERICGWSWDAGILLRAVVRARTTFVIAPKCNMQSRK